jgi:5'(3')-deoxyribonucleotidase
MKLLLDMDGVLADFVTGACTMFNAENPYHDPANAGKWDFVPLLRSNGIDLPISESGFLASLDWKFWAGLPVMHDAYVIYDICVKAVGPKNLAILTSPPETNYVDCLFGKKEWLRKHFPNHPERNFIPTSAKEFCAHRDSFLVDDADHNIDPFTSEGGHAYLIPRIWNTRHDESRTLFYDHLKTCLDEFVDRF